MNSQSSEICIIGGGPAGLFAAYHLLVRGYTVDLYDHSSGLGKKFLVAGNGGLNLTHSENLVDFSLRYGKDSDLFSVLINEFSPEDLRAWVKELGVETFIGSSGRVFPKGLNSVELLSRWVDKLKSNPRFKLNLKYKLIKMNKDKKLVFQTEQGEVHKNAGLIILALGGASWQKTGSDGKWATLLRELGVSTAIFRPMNCGFERSWSPYFIKEIDYSPLKNIELSIKGKKKKGELMLTPFGIEGGAVYALSAMIRDEIKKHQKISVYLDLKPEYSIADILKRLKTRNEKTSLSNHLRKVLKIEKKQFILLKELLGSEELNNPELLAKKIKNLEIELLSTRPIEEAISTSGGVCFSELTKNLELKSIPGVYIVGEMLDFEAPTGGYLLQGCFSSAYRIIKAIDEKLKEVV